MGITSTQAKDNQNVNVTKIRHIITHVNCHKTCTPEYIRPPCTVRAAILDTSINGYLSIKRYLHRIQSRNGTFWNDNTRAARRYCQL